MGTLLLIGLLAALLAALGYSAPVQPPAQGVVERLVLGLYELWRLSAPQRGLWHRYLDALQGAS